jgi:transcriptional regulator GlxA family with amidase domain
MKTTVQKTTAVFLVPPQVHLLDLSGPVQTFYEAIEYGAVIDLKYISLQDKEVSASSGIGFSQLLHFSKIELERGDILFIPGMDYTLLTNRSFISGIRDFVEWMKLQHKKGVVLCSVCTGALLLAESGLLNGREATTHWKYLDDFQQRYPQVKVVSNRLFVDHDSIYTSAGVASGTDLALYILEKRYGSLFASTVARELVVYFRRASKSYGRSSTHCTGMVDPSL